ncbi:MAG: response regulator transcription factor [Verrucomicrobiae bacterium]
MNAAPQPIETATSPASMDEMKVETAPTSNAKLKVWLVDDNATIRTLVGELLGQEDGIECARHFSSPVNLLSTLASQPGPDVILLDVQMGEHNGLDAVRPIKSLAPSTRVLMFTTCFNSEWRERALNDGASDYLLKTSEFKNVVARIRCPANDAKPKLQRRQKVPSVNRLTVDKSPRWVNHSLGILRALWN